MIINKQDYIDRKAELFKEILKAILGECRDRDFSTVYEAEYRASEFMRGLREEG